MQNNMRLWTINAFVIVSKTCMYFSSLEKKKVGNSLTTSTWLYENYKLKWPSFNNSCAWIESWKIYARIVCSGLMKLNTTKLVVTLTMTKQKDDEKQQLWCYNKQWHCNKTKFCKMLQQVQRSHKWKTNNPKTKWNCKKMGEKEKKTLQ